MLLAVHNSSITAAGLFGLRGRSAHFDNVVVTPVTAQNAALQAFTDMFTKLDTIANSIGHWTEQVGAFYIVNGAAAVFSNNRAAPSLGLATLAGVSAANVTVQSTITVASGGNAGLVARYSGAGNGSYYLAAITSNGGTSYTAVIYVVRAGVVTKTVASKTFTQAGALTGILSFALSVVALLSLSFGSIHITGADATLTTGRGRHPRPQCCLRRLRCHVDACGSHVGCVK